MTDNLLSEIRRLIENEPLFKLRLSPDKSLRLEQISELEGKLPVSLIAMVGKTASFLKLDP